MTVEWRVDDEVFEDDDDSPNDWMQFANVTSQFPVYVIEILMVVDYAIYRRWNQLHSGRRFAEKSRGSPPSLLPLPSPEK